MSVRPRPVTKIKYGDFEIDLTKGIPDAALREKVQAELAPLDFDGDGIIYRDFNQCLESHPEDCEANNWAEAVNVFLDNRIAASAQAWMLLKLPTLYQSAKRFHETMVKCEYDITLFAAGYPEFTPDRLIHLAIGIYEIVRGMAGRSTALAYDSRMVTAERFTSLGSACIGGTIYRVDYNSSDMPFIFRRHVNRMAEWYSQGADWLSEQILRGRCGGICKGSYPSPICFPHVSFHQALYNKDFFTPLTCEKPWTGVGGGTVSFTVDR